MELFILRHGKTEWNELQILQGELDSKLLYNSILQILNLKERFNNEKISFDVVCSSPSTRAIETVNLLGYQNIKIKKEFAELKMGEIQGKTYAEFESTYPTEYFKYFNNAKSYDPKEFSGESYHSLIERIESGIESLKKEYFGKKVLLVSHGITIQGVISYLNNGYVDLEDFSKIPVPDNLELYIFKIGG